MVVVCDSPLPFPPKKTLQAQTIRLFFVSDELFICVHLIISCFFVFFLVKLHYLKKHWFIPFHHPHSYSTDRLILHSSQLPFQLYLTSFMWHTGQVLLPSTFRSTFLFLSSHFFSVCVWHIRSLWSCESTAKALSLSSCVSQGRLTPPYEDVWRIMELVKDRHAVMRGSWWCGCLIIGNYSFHTLVMHKSP